MPASYEEAFQNGFLAVLADRLKTDFHEEAQTIREEIEKTTSDLIERNQAYIKDAPSHCHLAMTSLFLATYRGKHGIVFDRPTAIGYGDDKCRFQFRRVK